MQHIKDVAKLERFKARIADTLAALPAAEDVLYPPNATICPVCLGFGFFTPDVPPDDPAFGKAVKCTNEDCPVVRRNAQIRAEKISGQLEPQYVDFTFETWQEQIPAVKLAGKQLPFAVLRYFAQAPFTPFSLADMFDAMKKASTYQRYERDGVEFLRVDLARGRVEDVQNSRGNWIVLEGDYGTGKTGLAVAAMHALRQRGYAVAFIRLPDFLRAYQDTYRMQDATEQERAQKALVTPVQGADVLVVDEVNVAGGEDRASEDKIRLFQDLVINPRWLAAYRKPVVMTTNLSADAFEAHWDSRIATRIFERAHWLRMAGVPIRHRNRPV